MPLPTVVSYLGIAKEATKGTGVAPTAFIPVKTIEPFDKVEYYPVDVLQGAMTEIYDEVPGYKWTEFTVGGPFFADTYAWPLAGVLGDAPAPSTSRTVTDGVTTSASTTVTSATAAFTAVDEGKPITAGSNLPAGTYILSVTSATAVVVSQPATASGTALSTTIGAASLFTNTFSLQNAQTGSNLIGQPTSHTLTDFYGITGSNSRQYAGFQWTEAVIKFNTDGLLELTGKGAGLKSSALVAKPAQSFTTTLPIPTWAGNLNIGGSVVSKAMEGEITLSRKFEVIKALTGNQQPAVIFLGAFEAKGKITFYIDDDTELLRYLNNTQPSLDLLWVTGSGAATQGLQVHGSQVAFINSKIVRSKQMAQVEAEFQFIPNTTDVGTSGGFSPLLVRTQSAVNGVYI